MNECLMSIKVNNRSANDCIIREIHSDENIQILSNYTTNRKEEEEEEER